MMKEAFAGFPYLTTKFKVIDNNTMTFSFTEHQKDVQKYKETQLVDLEKIWRAGPVLQGRSKSLHGN